MAVTKLHTRDMDLGFLQKKSENNIDYDEWGTE